MDEVRPKASVERHQLRERDALSQQPLALAIDAPRRERNPPLRQLHRGRTLRADHVNVVAGVARSLDEHQSRRAARRASLSKTKLQLFDFGSAEHRGMLKGFGLSRRFIAVDKRALWNKELGYGFDKEALSDEDAHWIADSLERDGVRVDPAIAFRIQVPKGSHRVRVRATPFDNSKPLAALTARRCPTDGPAPPPHTVISQRRPSPRTCRSTRLAAWTCFFVGQSGRAPDLVHQR